MEKRGLVDASACCLCCNVRRAARAVSEYYDRALRPVGLRCTQIILLGTAQAMQPVRVKELAAAVDLDRTTLSRNLKVLQRRGLIHIVPGQDLRVRVITLTERGEDALRIALPLWERAIDHFAKRFGPKRFSRLLSDLSAAIDIASEEIEAHNP